MKLSQHLIFWSFFGTVLLLMILSFKLEHISAQSAYAEYTYTNVYLDTSFSDDEGQIIREAADEWHQATGGRVNYHVVRLPAKNIDYNSSIIMIKVTENFPEVTALDIRDEDQTWAYNNYLNNIHYIALVTDRISDSYYKTVILHEFGHSLGLEHPKQPLGKGTLMYHYITESAEYITDTDLYNFCQIHHCVSWDLHDQEKSSHF